MSYPPLLQPEISQVEINAAAVEAYDAFRGAGEPSDFRNRMLALLFFKSISDVWKDREAQYHIELKGDQEQIKRRMSRERFLIPKGRDFDSIYRQRNEVDLAQRIDETLSAIEEANRTRLEGIFRNIRFGSELPEKTPEYNPRLRALIQGLADPRLDLRPSRNGARDVVGDVAQVLIEGFASDAGKKGGEFYTPPEVAGLLAILLHPERGARIYDPICGSGSLLIRLADEIPERDFALYGQEPNDSIRTLCRMNLLLHGKDDAQIEVGDSLNDPKFLEEGRLAKFDIVTANLLFTPDAWEAGADRYHRYHRGLPPRSKAEYAFLSHMIESTVGDAGKAGAIVPHGVLFRGGAEGKIRQRLIEENLLECVVGLPANLFPGTPISAAMLLFNRGKKTSDVLFIDAGREYEAAKNRSRLRTTDIEKIVSAYRNFESIEGFAKRGTLQEVRKNDFLLNLSLYVDSPREETVDLQSLQDELASLEEELAEVRTLLKHDLSKLGF